MQTPDIDIDMSDLLSDLPTVGPVGPITIVCLATVALIQKIINP